MEKQTQGLGFKAWGMEEWKRTRKVLQGLGFNDQGMEKNMETALFADYGIGAVQASLPLFPTSKST